MGYTIPVPESPDVTVILVHREGWDRAIRCLAAVRATVRSCSCEAVLIDNASKDDASSEAVRAAGSLPVTLLRNAGDLGYGSACDQGMKLARGRYLLLIDPDVELAREAVDRAVHHLDLHPDIGVLGGRLVDERGAYLRGTTGHHPTLGRRLLQRLGSPYLPPLAGKGCDLRREPAEPTDVDWVSPVFLWVRRTAADKGGPLGARPSDRDRAAAWCRRIRQAGWRVVYFPHAQGMSRSSDRASFR